MMHLGYDIDVSVTCIIGINIFLHPDSDMDNVISSIHIIAATYEEQYDWLLPPLAELNEQIAGT